MSSHQPSEPAVACFAVRAAADPGTLPRILELFAKRGLVPSSVHSRMSGTGEAALLMVDLQIDGLTGAQVEVVAEQLRQIVVVERVLTARKRLSRAVA
jgi:acetolactate synthase small subunit